MHKPIDYTVDLKSGCFICNSHYKDKWGYPRIMSKGKKMNMSHYVYEQHYKVKLLPNTIIMHTCDNPSCINPEHLRAATHKENMEDRNNKCRQAYGERNGRAKLKECQVEEIIRSDLPKTQLSRIYGVAPKVIRQIKNGELWRHVFERICGRDSNIHDNVSDMTVYKQNPHHTDNLPHHEKAV